MKALNAGLRSYSDTRRSGWYIDWKGREFSSTALMALKMAVFAPIPSASANTAAHVKIVFFRS
jgi:hypothetical protein